MRGHMDDEDKFPSATYAACHYTAVAWQGEQERRKRPDYEPVPLPVVIREAMAKAQDRNPAGTVNREQGMRVEVRG